MNLETLKDYVKKVRRIQWFICTIPLGGHLLKKESAFGFPPLGEEPGIWIFFVMVLCGVAAILPLAIPIRRSKVPLLVISCLLLLCSTVGYFYLGQKYIVSIPAGDHGKLSVSVGFVRTPFANEVAGVLADQKNEALTDDNTGKGRLSASDITDTELLMEHGPYESEVKKFWTESSIDKVRLGLFISYLGVLMLANFVVGLIAIGDGTVMNANEVRISG
jgi:hypothetical protein